MNVMTLARKQVAEVETAEVVETDAPEAIAHEDIPKRVELDMVSVGQKSDNHREQFTGALDEARSVRAKAYIPAGLGVESIELMAKDAVVKVLEHGEARFTWDDKDEKILVVAFTPASEDVTVKRFNLTF